MNRKQTKQIISTAYDLIIEELAGNGRSKRLHGYDQAIRHRSMFESCGRILKNPYGRKVQYWCRRPSCPTCANHWGRKLGRSLVAACSDSEASDYRMITLVVGFAPTPDDAFDVFRALRRTLRNALDHRRRTAGIDRSGWRRFGLAGSLELDMFRAEDFAHLGTDKRSQYRVLGYQPEQASGPQWVVTCHALVHVGSLGDNAVREFLAPVAPVVHLEGLHEDKDLNDNAEEVVGYAAKVRMTTNLAGGEVRMWPPEAVRAYLAAAMQCSRGRQGFKLSMKPAGIRKKLPAEYEPEYIDPMPVLI